MMLPQDALLLAATKLKTRRIRLIVTVVVAGLLFVLLSTVSIVMNGAIKSVESFSEEGLGKRYIVQLNPALQDDYSLQFDPQLVADAKVKFEQLKKEKSATAKKIGAQYDPLSEQSPVFEDGGLNGEDGVDVYSKIGKELVAERIKDSAKEYYAAVKNAQNGYDIVGQYSSVALGGYFGAADGNSITTTTIKNGIEQQTAPGGEDFNSTRGIDGVKNGVIALSDEVLGAFALKDQSFAVVDGIVPIVAPYSASEEVLGLTALPTGAKPKERLDRLKTVREQIAGKTFQVCLRNQESVERQQTATQQVSDFAANKDKKGYIKPDLMFAVANEPCQDVIVTRDVRTLSQKNQEAKQDEFEKLYGKQSPKQRIVTFKVVGITADPPEFASFGLTDIINSILTSSVGSGWFVPLSSADALSEYSASFAKIGSSTDYDLSTYIEFTSADNARKFTKEKSCQPGGVVFSGTENNFDPFAGCRVDGKPFFTNSFGSSSIALDELRSGFSNIFSKVMLVVALISALIMMGTVGKIIADSRRETAVFRAIGAKKLDIAQIYITYTLLIAVIISTFAIIVGWLLASFVNGRYGNDFTVQSLVSFNASNLDKKFSLIGIEYSQLGLLILVILAGSLLASIIPLLSNLRRNPIKDMRDER